MAIQRIKRSQDTIVTEEKCGWASLKIFRGQNSFRYKENLSEINVKLDSIENNRSCN